LQALAPATAAVLAAIAKDKAEIQSRHAAHRSTQTTLGKGEVIEGGGYVFSARCRQTFHVREVLHGKDRQDRPGDQVLEYGFVEKTEGFPLPAIEKSIPAGAEALLLVGEKGHVLRALPDTPENRKILRTVLSKRKGEKAEPEASAPTHKASDVMLIANWLCGNDPDKAFARPFGDSKCLTDSKDPLLYTDIADVKTPAGLKTVNYEFIHARMQRIKSGHAVSPAVVIVHASLDEPNKPNKDAIRRHKGEPGGRVYYVEVAIGNLAWHWLKVIVRDEGEKPHVEILWRKVS
jgi:hypothetical protein